MALRWKCNKQKSLGIQLENITNAVFTQDSLWTTGCIRESRAGNTPTDGKVCYIPENIGI